MLPASQGETSVHVVRALDVDEDTLLDAITAFALVQDLESDRRHDGDGLVFRRKKESTPEVTHLLKKGDALQVIITAEGAVHDVEFIADLSGSIKRKTESRRAGAFRAGAWATMFGAVAAINLARGVNVADFIWVLLSARSVRHVTQALGPPAEAIDELQRDLANALNRVCDDAEEAS